MLESNAIGGISGSGGGSYRAGVLVAAAAAFLAVWTTIVRDDGHGLGVFMVIMAVAVGWFAAGFRAAGMARTMAGAAVMQAAAALLTATAPVVAEVPGESAKALLYGGFFAVLWLASAACFRAAAKRERSAP